MPKISKHLLLGVAFFVDVNFSMIAAFWGTTFHRIRALACHFSHWSTEFFEFSFSPQIFSPRLSENMIHIDLAAEACYRHGGYLFISEHSCDDGFLVCRASECNLLSPNRPIKKNNRECSTFHLFFILYSSFCV